jgi:hypothetical protein
VQLKLLLLLLAPRRRQLPRRRPPLEVGGYCGRSLRSGPHGAPLWSQGVGIGVLRLGVAPPVGEQ